MNRIQKQLSGTFPLGIGVVLFALLLGCVPLSPNATIPPSPTPDTTTSADADAGEIEANGITLVYESFGPTDGETMLLIGGVGMQLVDWPLELVDELVQQGYHVVRFDNRDVGRSTHMTEAGLPDAEAIGAALEAGEPAPVPYSFQDLAQDAVGLLDALEIQQAHLVGLSMGGTIAQLIAMEFPERTRSLTIIAGGFGDPTLPVIADPDAFAAVPPQPETADRAAFIAWQVETWQALAGPDDATDEATLHAWAARNFARGFDPAALVRHQTVSLAGHLEGAAYQLEEGGAIAVPTTVIQGTADPLVSVVAAEDVASRIPDAELQLIPGMGHFVPIALAPALADAIVATARQAEPQSGAAPNPASSRSFTG
jgi:pimeloyl-ACP methyl ester carboxylesterase